MHVNKQEVGTLAFFQRSYLIRPAKRTRAFDRRPEVRRASIPSSGGVMNARSLARLYAMLASNGEWEGQRLLSEERLSPSQFIQKQLALLGSFVFPIDAYEDIVGFVTMTYIAS